MIDGGDDRSSLDDPDSFLRAVAEAPECAPEKLPERVAHFRVVGRLGRGGMGVVYRAHDETLGRDVALKLLPEASEDDDRRQRFLVREARAAAGITHPNVAVVHQVGEADGRGYIAMELVGGESLRQKIDRGPLTVAAAHDIATQIARGLAAAHALDIVHRDLKPENVMITSAGVVKLLDFGLAKSTAEQPGPAGGPAAGDTLLTTVGRVMGTPAYMSPEQASGAPVDARSDVFTFGVVFYEMLCGERPFTGHSRDEVLGAIQHDPPPPLRERAPGLDAETEAIVMRCLAKAPADRFANATEIVAALDGVTTAGTMPGREPSRRRRTAALALGAMFALGAGAFAWPNGTPALRSAETPAASEAAPTPTRIVDIPPPQTSVPAAAAAYTAGIQAIYDNTWIVAAVHLQKAVTLDPSMAAAHLRLSIMSLPARIPDVRRAEFEKAAGLRSRLSPRDQEILEAMQPYLQADVQDVAEAGRRLRALVERYPNDTEILMYLSVVHYFTPEALPIADRALALDPRDPYQWEAKADALAVQGNFVEARAAYEKCAAFSIDGAECFAVMGFADRAAGNCKEYAANMRRASDRSPFWLALSLSPMASTGATPQMLEETITQAVRAMPPFFGPEFHKFALEARLAIVTGDFDRAEAFAKKATTALAADPMIRSVYWLQLENAVLLLDIAQETGDEAATQRIASDFVARSQAWPIEMFLGQGVDVSLAVARLAHPTHEPPPAAFEATRRAWIERRVSAGAYKGQVWNYAWALPALSTSEARAATDALAELGPPAPMQSIGAITMAGRVGSPEAAIGRVHLLAGRIDQAIPHLRRAAAACDLFDSTLDHVRASLDLGRALEQKGDTAGACDAYRGVLAVWGNAKPRSVTADDARAHATALGCSLDG